MVGWVGALVAEVDAALKEVLKTLVDNGGRVFDAMHGNGASEQFHATIANELVKRGTASCAFPARAPSTPT